VETNQAKAALEEIGGAPAEEAAWALLNRVDDTPTKLTALSVLEKVGGASTVADLRNYATASEDEPARRRALAAANAIEARLRTPAPAP
jgi:HEAT repeat protein